MSDQNRFDIIIAGAGAAGLSLLWHIMESTELNDQKILLIDQSFEPAADKTWCFWEELPRPHNQMITHSWDQLKVNIGGETYSDLLKKYKYQCLRGDDYTGYILRKAKESDQIHLLKAEIHDFSSDANTGTIQTSEGDFKSNKIFQSALKPPEFKNLKVDISLIQHFLGWEVSTSQNLFDPELATFMDFEVPQIEGTSFIYLLPFSNNKALVEYTIFSKSLIDKARYRDQISRYLNTRYNIFEKDYVVEREEFGAIPMEDRKYPAKYCKFVWNIGTVGGLAKPSTGYTFSRIQKQSAEIVEALEKGHQIPEQRASSFRFRVYDIMMLYLLKYEKENALNAFHSLFQNNNFDRVLQFLSEDSSLLEELTIFSKMPYTPYFRSIYNMKHRILTGG